MCCGSMASNTATWVHAKLRKTGLHAPTTQIDVQHQELCVGKEAEVPEQEEEEVELSIVALLKACAKRKDFLEGSRIHAEVLRKGWLHKNIFIGSALVNVYAKCGATTQAQKLFDELPSRDLVTWNALISGYSLHEHGDEVLHCFKQMQQESLSPSPVTFACILKACGSIRAIEKGRAIHIEIVRRRLLEENTILGTALVDMYAKCGALSQAHEVFEDLNGRDVVVWNALIVGYTQHGQSGEALDYFKQMLGEGVAPNSVTFLCVLQACGIVRAVDKGKEIHARISSEGSMGKDHMLCTAMLDMYAKGGALTRAQEVFDELPWRDLVAWNALLAGYCQHGHGEEVLDYIDRMQNDGLYPNAMTFLGGLQACVIAGDIKKGNEIHAEIVRHGLLGKDNILGNALVDMYAKLGALARAQEVFNDLLTQDKVAWTALIVGYCQHGHGKEALDRFEQMLRKGLSPDPLMYACLLQACGSVGATETGKELHAQMTREGFMGQDCALGSALVDMYAKCGDLPNARGVFDKLHLRNVETWTAFIAAFAQIGDYEMVLKLFDEMVGDGIRPNRISFVVLLNACGCVGRVGEGQMYYENMSVTHGVVPTVDHHSCMVDLFGRVGYFEKAITLIEKVPSLDHLPLWLALLDSCKRWGNVRVGNSTLEHFFLINPRE